MHWGKQAAGGNGECHSRKNGGPLRVPGGALVRRALRHCASKLVSAGGKVGVDRPVPTGGRGVVWRRVGADFWGCLMDDGSSRFRG